MSANTSCHDPFLQGSILIDWLKITPNGRAERCIPFCHRREHDNSIKNFKMWLKMLFLTKGQKASRNFHTLRGPAWLNCNNIVLCTLVCCCEWAWGLKDLIWLHPPSAIIFFKKIQLLYTIYSKLKRNICLFYNIWRPLPSKNLHFIQLATP